MFLHFFQVDSPSSNPRDIFNYFFSLFHSHTFKFASKNLKSDIFLYNYFFYIAFLIYLIRLCTCNLFKIRLVHNLVQIWLIFTPNSLNAFRHSQINGVGWFLKFIFNSLPIFLRAINSLHLISSLLNLGRNFLFTRFTVFLQFSSSLTIFNHSNVKAL